MKKLLCIFLCVSTLLLNVPSIFAQEIKPVENIEGAKAIIEKYLTVSMKKYDRTTQKEIVSYEGIIDESSSFYDYAEKMAVLTNNRYKSFDELKIESVIYNIEYYDIEYIDGVYTVEASVLETHKYSGQDDLGYICTEHIFIVTQYGDEFYIYDDISDDYVDIYLRNQKTRSGGMTIDQLIEEDKKYIAEEISAKDDNDINLNENISKETNDNARITTYKFNYTKMYDYAGSYNKASPNKIKDRNPDYANFDNDGGDCTNYISQIMKAGGAPLDDTGDYQWYYYNSNNRAPSWTSVNKLRNYLKNNDYIGPQGYVLKDSPEYQASKGDYIQLDIGSDGSFDHSLWIIAHQTGTTSLTKVACHTTDKWNVPLNSFVGNKKWIKLSGYGK